MTQKTQLGQAGLSGWREKVADKAAPATAQRTPLGEDQVRALIGAAFFVLSVVYVVSTAKKMARTARG